jgi:outer membrane protein TolC
VAKGGLPRLDEIEAEGEVKRREGLLTKAARDIEKAQIKLSLYTTLDASSIKLEIVPEPPSRIDAITENADQIARSSRPELRAISFVAQTIQQDLALAKNDRLPNLDLVLTPGIDAGRNSVGFTCKAGLLYSIPQRQNTADGRIDQAKQKLKKIEFDRILLEREIITEVNDAKSAVARAIERAELGEEELRLTRELELGERLRFEAGDSTLFLLNQRERASAESAARLVDIYADVHLAIAQLQAAKVII